MKLDARLLTLLGVMVVVAVLGLGLVSVALPMYQGVRAAEGEIATSEQTNLGYQAKLAELSAAEGQRAEIDRRIEVLREQLPRNAQSESVLRVIRDALRKHRLVIKRDTFAEPVPFAPRAAAASDGAAAAEAEQPAAPPAAADDSAAAPPADSSAGSSGNGEAASPANGEAAPADPQQQIEVTIEVAVPGEAAASRFLSALGAGPRLVLPVSAKLEREADETTGMPGRLTVTMLVFFRTEDPS